MNSQVAEIIKEDLWPNPLKYFNNVTVYYHICSLSFSVKNFLFIGIVTEQKSSSIIVFLLL